MKTLIALVAAWLIAAMTCASGCAPVPQAPLNFTSSAREPTKQVDTSSPVFLAQLAVMKDMYAQYTGLEVEVIWWPCETLNSFYSPSDKQIILCTEFAEYPEVAVFVAAHEMGHAIAFQLLKVADEESADEIAALALIETGRALQLLEAALYFKMEGGDRVGGAGHPSNNFRAWNLACLAAGADGSPAKCVALYQGTKARWEQRLAKWRRE